MESNADQPVVPSVLQIPGPSRLWLAAVCLESGGHRLSAAIWSLSEQLTQEGFVDLVKQTVGRDHPDAVIELMTVQLLELRPNEGVAFLTVNGSLVPTVDQHPLL